MREKPFVYFRDQTINFSTLDRKVNRAANALRELGVTKGDSVCLFLPNCLEFLYLWFGLAKIGAVVVSLNTSFGEEDLQYIINHCDAKWIVVDERFYHVYSIIEKRLPNIKHQIWRSEAAEPAKGFISLSNSMEAVTEKAPTNQDIKDGDPLGIIYSSSTTAPPKGVIISHFNYINMGHRWAYDVIHCEEDDIFFTTLPLFHANAQMFTVMGSLCSKRPFVLKEQFSASHFFDEVRQSRATVFNHIGDMLPMMLNEPPRKSDFGNPPRATFGGILPPEIRKEFERRFSVTCIEGYGHIESGGICLFKTPENYKPGSAGKRTGFFEVAIWDENNQELPRGETGEIVIKEKVPHTLFIGYYKQPDKTAEALEGGAFHTGDAGWEDEDGFFYIVGRTKNYNRRHGEKLV